MAAPSYTTDLTTIAIGSISVDTGTWDESTDAGWDTGGSMVDDANLYYNGTACVSAQMVKDSNGAGTNGPATIMYVHGSTWTIPTDGAVLLHHYWAAPPALSSLANGGVGIILGNGLGDFGVWDCSGADFKPAPRGGWANYALNPAVRTAEDTVGVGASSPYTTVGGAVRATAQSRGNPHACNAIRYGRCTSIYTLGDLANGYATFAGYGLVDATSTNKWNLLDPIDGGYSHQGLMSLGTAATAVDFRDSNTNISIANTINVTAAFNRIEVHHIDSNVEWTGISITKIGTVSKGDFEMVDNASFTGSNCTFTDMNTFIFKSNATLKNNTTFRRTNLVTQNSATFTKCIFDESTATTSLLSDDPGLITDCTFNSDGGNHAIEISTTGTYNLSDNKFDNYATTNGTGGNEVIYNNSGGAVTLNASGNVGIISIRNGSGATTTLNNNVNVTISGLKDNTEIRVLAFGTNTELAGIENATAGTTNARTFTFSLASSTATTIKIHSLQYEHISIDYTVPSSTANVPIQQRFDRTYLNA